MNDCVEHFLSCESVDFVQVVRVASKLDWFGSVSCGETDRASLGLLGRGSRPELGYFKCFIHLRTLGRLFLSAGRLPSIESM